MKNFCRKFRMPIFLVIWNINYWIWILKLNRVKKHPFRDSKQGHWHYVPMLYHWTTWTISCLELLICWQGCIHRTRWNIFHEPLVLGQTLDEREPSLDEIEYTQFVEIFCSKFHMSIWNMLYDKQKILQRWILSFFIVIFFFFLLRQFYCNITGIRISVISNLNLVDWNSPRRKFFLVSIHYIYITLV